MRKVQDQLKAWAGKELKYWEQAALGKIAGKEDLNNDDIEELVQFFIEDAGLAPIPENRPLLSLLEDSSVEPAHTQCRLIRILNLRNVNALPEGQELHFGPQLTLFYGNNGTGKSGYARALGSAGFARGERHVLPNATGMDTKEKPQADIEVSCPDGNKVITWTDGKQCPELSGFYVFDGDSLPAHLRNSNSLSFTPGGLSLLTRLADVTDSVRQKIRERIESNEVPSNFEVFFDGDSNVKNQIKNLDAQANLVDLRNLGELTPKEREEITVIEGEIAKLKVLNVNQRIEKLKQDIRHLENLIQAIKSAQAGLNDSALANVSALIEKVRTCRDVVESSGVTQFKFDSFSQVGSEEWRQFVTAAKKLADAEINDGSAYPRVGDHCLLCRQTLSDEAVDLIRRLWAFLSSDAEAKLRLAENACDSKIRELQRLNLGYFALDSNARRILEEELGTIIPALDAQIESCLERWREAQKALASREACSPPPLIEVDLTEILGLIDLRRKEVRQMETSDIGQRMIEAERSLRELRHRQILGEKYSRISEYVDKRKWAAKARESLGSTRAITTKYNDLFNELVTESYRSLFEETLKRFGRDIKVTIETRGFKGGTVRQVVLNPKSFRHGFTVEQILSEGEKRAVAIADYLTEAALDEHNNGIILDDPVTSLDNEWRCVLAGCLAEFARNRQVVVFTHDLSFLYQIKKRAAELEVDVLAHWIREENGRPGFVYLKNSPLCERDYKSAKIATEFYSRAKNAPPAEQQNLLQQGFGALRTSYEALIIFDIFSDVVIRFEERISFGRLKYVRIDPALVEEIIQRMEAISQYIDAHLHSDAFGAVKPSPDTLHQEIAAFESIRQKQKDLKKTAS